MWRSAQCWMFICTCVKFSLMNWWRPFERHAVPRRCSGRKEVESIKSFFTRLLLITTTRTQLKLSINHILYRIFTMVCVWVWNSNRLCSTTLHDWLKKKKRATFSSIRGKTKPNRYALAQVSPRLALATCNYFEFLLVYCITFDPSARNTICL